MILQFYQAAEIVRRLMAAHKEQYVKIIAGKRKGSVAKVVSVRHVNYRHNQFYLEIGTRRKFWLHGKHLEHLPTYCGDTFQIISNDLPPIYDIMGKQIRIGNVIIFHKIIDDTSCVRHQLIIGTVILIRHSGSLVIKPIINGKSNKSLHNLITLRNNRCLIIRRNNIYDLVLLKLTN